MFKTISYKLKRTKKIRVNNQNYKVINHWFWKEFSRGWELDTYEIIKKYSAFKNYIDIGAWIGPSVFYAHSNNAKKIFAVEANPPSYSQLVQNINMNSSVQQCTHTTNICISNRKKWIKFGSNLTTSGASTRGNAFEVPACSLSEYLALHSINQIGLLKIDIEGEEINILQDICKISIEYCCPVFLSIHPPFYRKKNHFCNQIKELSKDLLFFDSKEKSLTYETIEKRVLSEQAVPDWSTNKAQGNFFEILVKPKNYGG